MTIRDILKLIEEIKVAANDGDDEVAHTKEAALKGTFIESLTNRKDILGKKARLVLSTNKIDFSRWYA